MIPLHDENPTRSFPAVTVLLILANAAVFLYQLMIGIDVSALWLGLVPAELLSDADTLYAGRRWDLPPGVSVTNLDPSWTTIFTSMFMHGSWLHIIGNMWFLWIFGNNVEDSMGKGKFIAFYLVCGIAAALAQVFLSGNSPIPMVGASGALAGVLGAYLVIFPHSRVTCLLFLGFFITTIVLPAFVVLGFWFLLQVINGAVALGPKAGGGVAYAAHVGGFVAGWLLAHVAGPGRNPEPPRRYTRQTDFMDWR